MGLRGKGDLGWLGEVERGARALSDRNRQERPALLRQTASGEWEALDALDGMRWLNGVAHHAWRTSYYLAGERTQGLVADAEGWPG